MTLQELSKDYAQSAALLLERMRELRQQLKKTQDAETVFWLKRRIAVLSQMRKEAVELAELTAHYYERSYWRNEKYRI